MNARLKLGLIAVLGVIVAVVLLGVWQGSSQREVKAQKNVTISLSKEDYTHVVDIPTAYTVEYESYYWLELTLANFERLRARGVEYKLEENATVLKFWDYQFKVDPFVGEPSLPAELTSVYTSGVPNLYIVQWIGPQKEEWLDTLRGQGMITLGSRAGNSYLVQMTPEQAATVEKLDFVRWIGPYHPAYRISPRLWQYSEVIDRLNVTIYNDDQTNGTVEHTIKEIEALGGTLIQQSKFRAPPIANAVFRFPAPALIQVAQLSNVISLDYSSLPSLP